MKHKVATKALVPTGDRPSHAVFGPPHVHTTYVPAEFEIEAGHADGEVRILLHVTKPREVVTTVLHMSPNAFRLLAYTLIQVLKEEFNG